MAESRVRIGASTLSEAIYNMMVQGKQESQEFQAMIKFWGEDKVMRLYLEEYTHRQTLEGQGAPIEVETELGYDK